MEGDNTYGTACTSSSQFSNSRWHPAQQRRGTQVSGLRDSTMSLPEVRGTVPGRNVSIRVQEQTPAWSTREYHSSSPLETRQSFTLSQLLKQEKFMAIFRGHQIWQTNSSLSENLNTFSEFDDKAQYGVFYILDLIEGLL